MTIKRDSIWANPYRDHPRMNGIRRYDQHLAVPDDSLDAPRGLVYALILGMAAWGLVGVLALLILEVKG